MKNIELLSEQSGFAELENKHNLTSENTEYNNTQIEGTPLMARTINGVWFATIGKYKVTEDVETREMLLDLVYTKPLEWEDLNKLLAAQADYNEAKYNAIANRIEELEKLTNTQTKQN